MEPNRVIPSSVLIQSKTSILTLYFPLRFLIWAVLCFLYVNGERLGENEVESCDEVYFIDDAPNGTIHSLRYPKPYPKSRYCEIELRGNSKHRVTLNFEDFYLSHPSKEKQYRQHASCDGLDTLHIYDGLNEDAKLLGEYCGGRKPPGLMSSGPHLFLRLTSYALGLDARGFSAKYYFVNNFGINSGIQKTEGVCEFEYDSKKKKEGKFTSPNPGGTYPTNTNCSYIFEGNFLERIFLEFHAFDLEGIEPCTARSGSDFLEFSNLPGYDPCPARRCGRFIPQEVISDGSYLRITFRSNDRLNGFGFFASYKFVTDEHLPKWASYLKTNAAKSFIRLNFSFWNVGRLLLLAPLHHYYRVFRETF